MCNEQGSEEDEVLACRLLVAYSLQAPMGKLGCTWNCDNGPAVLLTSFVRHQHIHP